MGYVVSGPKASLWEAFDHVARGWIPGRRLHEGCSISNTAPFSLAVARAIAVALAVLCIICRNRVRTWLPVAAGRRFTLTVTAGTASAPSPRALHHRGGFHG